MTLLALIATGSACLNRPLQPVDVHLTSTVLEKAANSRVDKIDLLLAIDNSSSMADKTQILNLAVPDLVDRLVNPRCVDPKGVPELGDGGLGIQTGTCGKGFSLEFPPIKDIHIGVVSSSLGSFGGDACPDVPDSTKPTCTSTNDHGHLITRADDCNQSQVATYVGADGRAEGFLAWDPGRKDMPPGETDSSTLKNNLTQIVVGNGQVGCGFESQNESWLRFLVDPNPYQTISLESDSAGGQSAVTKGTDDVLLQERKDFLRPDSLLAIILLTDENDGSAIEGGAYYLIEQRSHMVAPRTECVNNPLDNCCRSCLQQQTGCPDEPACDAKTLMTDADDPLNLRMFDNKRRFGLSFLYPTQRYVNALTQPLINPAASDLGLHGAAGVPNPIFSDLQGAGAPIRTADIVFLAGIVGVPWQDIAVDSMDLTQGFKDADALNQVDANGHTVWDIILGDPDTYKEPPLDPHMIEQIDPRTNPVTGTPLAAPDSPADADPINGHEYVSPNRDDLQYACIFPLKMPRECAGAGNSCDCSVPAVAATNPLCAHSDKDPTAGNKSLQVSAKAYPGVRHLQILKGLGAQGIVASVCPKQIDRPEADDYGYRPAVAAIIDRLKSKLGVQCLRRSLTPDKTTHEAPCVVISARKQKPGEVCCDSAKGRIPVAPSHIQAQAEAAADPTAPKTNPWDCFCEISQTKGDDLTACQNDTADPPLVGGAQVNGWCYIDGTTFPPTGNTDLLSKCDAEDQREIRFVGLGNLDFGESAFINCANSEDTPQL